jgi:hypothetical protein
MSRAETSALRVCGCLFLFALAVLCYVAMPGPPAAETFGWQPDPEGAQEFLGQLPVPFFADAAPEAMRRAKPIDTFLYRQMDRAHRARYGKPFVIGRQGIGDCVAWGAMHAVYCAESIDWDLGRLAEAPLIPSTESIYGGSRVEARGKSGDGKSPVGGYSDGSTGFGAAKWLRDFGVVYRSEVGGHDLRVYDKDRAKSWGAYGNGGQGDGGKLDQIAKKHPCKHVVQVRTWDELVAAIESGFPVTIASSQGFASRTDSAGVAAAQGTWMHHMAMCGIRFAANSPPGVRAVDAALVVNSWGTNWISYAGKYPADQPDGSFWAERPVVERILRQNDSWAIGSVDGFGWRDIHHDKWLQAGPIPYLIMVTQ